eukprot:159050_1
MRIISHDNIPTKIVSDATSCAIVLNELLSMNPKILGIDCEWVSKQKISLLQIANSKLIILIRLHKLNTIPGELISIMSNNKILKCGIGIYNDVKRLQNDYNIHTYGCIDMNDIFPLISNHKQLLANNNIYQLQLPMGLNKCSQILLNENMKYKHKKITISNWKNIKLTHKQILYAADDALVGYKLFIKAMQLSNINHNIDQYMDFCYGYIDIKHCNKSENRVKKINRKPDPNSKQTQVTNKKYPKHRKTKSFFDNCQILKPDGSDLCCCSLTRMNWYLNKNLAERIDNKTIKLKFQPKETHYLCLNKYHSSIIKNQCFVCGKQNEALYKFAVIPECYRKYIDDEYNNRAFRMHDFFPLCVNCRRKAIQCHDVLRDKLCEKYSVAYYRIKERNKNQAAFFKAKCAAAALCKKKKNKIPIKRKIELLEQVCGYYGLKYDIIYSEHENNNIDGKNEYDNLINIIEDNKNIMTYIHKLLDKNENPDKKQWELHSKSLMEIFKNKPRNFMEIWRQHFVDYMKPKCLPEMWTVNASNVIVESNCPACNIDFKS